MKVKLFLSLMLPHSFKLEGRVINWGNKYALVFQSMPRLIVLIRRINGLDMKVNLRWCGKKAALMKNQKI